MMFIYCFVAVYLFLLFTFSVCSLCFIRQKNSKEYWFFILPLIVSLLVSCVDSFWISPFRGIKFLFIVRFPLLICLILASRLIFIWKSRHWLRQVLIIFYLLWGFVFPLLFFVSEAEEMMVFPLLCPILIGTYEVHGYGIFVLLQISFLAIQLLLVSKTSLSK